jgi:hypothetical protein
MSDITLDVPLAVREHKWVWLAIVSALLFGILVLSHEAKLDCRSTPDCLGVGNGQCLGVAPGVALALQLQILGVSEI